MQFGAWQLDTINGGRFRIDGGVLFGLVPKTLWGPGPGRCPESRRLRQPLRPRPRRSAHGAHRYRLRDKIHAAGSQILRHRGRRSAFGRPCCLGRWRPTTSIRSCSPTCISTMRGALRASTSRGQIVPTFPKARYLVSRLEWDDATKGLPELQTAYLLDNLLPLADGGQLVLLDGDPAIVPGLTAFCTGGHTRGHLAVKFCSAGQTAMFLGDLCPTTAHLRRMWCTAYDVYPRRRAAANRNFSTRRPNIAGWSSGTTIRPSQPATWPATPNASLSSKNRANGCDRNRSLLSLTSPCGLRGWACTSSPVPGHED